MLVHNPPADQGLRESLQYVAATGWESSERQSNHVPTVLLVEDVDGSESIHQQVQQAYGSGIEDVLVCTLQVETATIMYAARHLLKSSGLHVVHDYTDPFPDPSVEKKVHFFSSDKYRAFIEHTFNEVNGLLSSIGLPDNSRVVPIGSDTLPDFPCKLDVDMAVCIPDVRTYRGFASALLDEGTFEEPREDIDEATHRFFYSELMGAPIDLHLVNQPLDECFLYKQVLALRRDHILRERYRTFKEESEGLTITEYRQAKTQFRKEVGWD